MPGQRRPSPQAGSRQLRRDRSIRFGQPHTAKAAALQRFAGPCHRRRHPGDFRGAHQAPRYRCTRGKTVLPGRGGPAIPVRSGGDFGSQATRRGRRPLPRAGGNRPLWPEDRHLLRRGRRRHQCADGPFGPRAGLSPILKKIRAGGTGGPGASPRPASRRLRPSLGLASRPAASGALASRVAFPAMAVCGSSALSRPAPRTAQARNRPRAGGFGRCRDWSASSRAYPWKRRRPFRS